MYIYDSRKVKFGDTFLCLPGGDPYCDEALAKGAKEILKVTRKEMARLVNSFFSYPSKHLKVIGVTGTNGKTSVCHFVAEVLKTLGYHPFTQGTLTHRLTTPESLDTFQAMDSHLKDGGTHFVMEVSSHGIAQDRVVGIDFDVTCLTNISQDHLDFHGSFEVYQQVKLGFMEGSGGIKIYPDDFQSVCLNDEASHYTSFQTLNKKAALAILLACGLDRDKALAALMKVMPPKGRFESVFSKAPFHVIVDYAHSPHGVEVVLKAAKEQLALSKGRLLVCYGCGGDRDRLKRPLMARVVSELSDYSVITNDNPRTEDPNQIVFDIKKGIQQGHSFEVKLDRKKAIEHVCLRAEKDDMVLIIGKGHESYQIIGDRTIPFSDVAVSQDILSKLGY